MALTDALAASRDGRGEVVLVGGDAGAGKTRLLDEFARRHDDALVLWGGCVKTGEVLAYQPWTELLGDLRRARGDDAFAGYPDLGRLLVRANDDAPTETSHGKVALFDEVAEVLAAAGADAPLVVVIEDADWIDPASADLLAVIANRIRRIPMLLVVTFRVEELSTVQALIADIVRSASRVTLEELPDDAALDLASALTGSARDSAEVAQIVERAAGNPLYFEELAHAGASGVPESLRNLLQARVEQMSTDAQEFVRVAAVVGRSASGALLGGAAQLDASSARRAAREAVDSAVLVVSGDEYTFRHALIRDVVFDALIPHDLVALHGAIAQAMEALPGTGLQLDRKVELAVHWDGAQSAAEALRWSVAAARAAVANYAFPAAASLYERVVRWWDVVDDATGEAGVDHVHLLLEAADAASVAGRPNDGCDLVVRALDEAIAADPRQSVDVVGRAIPHFRRAFRMDEMSEYTQVALGQLTRCDERAKAVFLVSHVDMLGLLGQLGDASELIQTMFDAADRHGEPGMRARALMVAADVSVFEGDFVAAEDQYRLAVHIARTNGLFGLLPVILYNLAVAISDKPDFVRALEVLDEVDAVVAEHGVLRMRTPSACMRAELLYRLGDLDRASAVLDALDELTMQGADHVAYIHSRAELLVQRGDPDGALLVLGADTGDAGLDANHLAMCAVARAAALAWNGAAVRARDVVERALAALKGSVELTNQGWLLLAGVGIEADARDEHSVDRARVLVEVWEELVARRRIEYPMLQAFSAGIHAEVARVRGVDVAPAAHAAAERFGALPSVYEATYFRWREGQARADDGDRKAAGDVLAGALATARERGYARLAEEIERTARAAQLRLGSRAVSVDGTPALSARELDVLRLLAEGMSNPQIGDALFISRGTAREHVSKILGKLGVSSRTEAVAVAQRRGIL